jgi:hypothetical protein
MMIVIKFRENFSLIIQGVEAVSIIEEVMGQMVGMGGPTLF